MGTHPIFESDFDCLTEIEMNSRRPLGPTQQFFISKVDDKNPPESELVKRLKKDLKRVYETDYSFQDPSYKGFKDDSKPNELNFDCPCVDNLPYGPCGNLWRRYMTEKEVEKKPEEVTQRTYLTWFECFSSNASVYMPEFLKSLERKKKEAEEKLAQSLAEEN